MSRQAIKRSTNAMHRLDVRNVHGIGHADSVTLECVNGKRWLIGLVRTPCNYGGLQAWWQCPRCGGRAGVLWGDSTGFACRHCQRLNYASTRVKVSSRPFDRANRVRERLGWGGGVASPMGDKPKGMHWRTYGQLLRELHGHALDALAITDNRTAGIRGKLERSGQAMGQGGVAKKVNGPGRTDRPNND